MEITSTEFGNKREIPKRFSCEGEGVNPPLAINDIPAETESLALIVEDPDAPGDTFVHWVVYDMPVKNVIDENSVPGTEGVNSAGKTSWYSPCPPSGTHRYFFKCYALDTKLGLEPGKSKSEVEQAIKDHVLAHAELVGLYGTS